MSKTKLQQVQDCLMELDNIAIERQAIFDRAWLLEKRTIEIRGEIHKLINGHEHL